MNVEMSPQHKFVAYWLAIATGFLTPLAVVFVVMQ
jgi:hypothetical protein